MASFSLSFMLASVTIPCAFGEGHLKFVVIVSANAEWRVVRKLFPSAPMERSPYGEYFYHQSSGRRGVIMQGGWGKIDAAASAQYAICRWHPDVVLNLGTCGGIEGQIEKFQTVLVERTVVYDIVEMMGDSAEAVSDYSTSIGGVAGVQGSAVLCATDGSRFGRSRLSPRRHS